MHGENQRETQVNPFVWLGYTECWGRKVSSERDWREEQVRRRKEKCISTVEYRIEEWESAVRRVTLSEWLVVVELYVRQTYLERWKGTIRLDKGATGEREKKRLYWLLLVNSKEEEKRAKGFARCWPGASCERRVLCASLTAKTNSMAKFQDKWRDLLLLE